MAKSTKYIPMRYDIHTSFFAVIHERCKIMVTSIEAVIEFKPLLFQLELNNGGIFTCYPVNALENGDFNSRHCCNVFLPTYFLYRLYTSGRGEHIASSICHSYTPLR